MDSPMKDKLETLEEKGCYPFHMPGHKRKKMDLFQKDLFSYDITEITDFDDLHHPEGIIRDTMDSMKKIYGTKESYLLVNSSTGGLLAAIAAVCNRNDTILIARNCHKSVYHGIQLLGLQPEYIYPEIRHGICRGITLDEVKLALNQNEKIKAVLIVSPTYEGNVSDIYEISQYLHQKQIPFIVDEAHGAHFEYHDAFPKSAVRQDADIVIQSLHKTLPALTQTGVLHFNSEFVRKERIEEYLGIFQSSSPSYILMASMDYCVRTCHAHREMFQIYVENLRQIRGELKALKHLRLMESDDIGKLVISTEGTNLCGEELFSSLRDEYQLELEMAETTYVVAMTSICDEYKDLERLKSALFSIDEGLNQSGEGHNIEIVFPRNTYKCSPTDAKETLYREVLLEDSIGEVSRDFIYLYPPGIPLLVPGEVISEEIICKIEEYLEHHMKVIGLKDRRIKVIDERK